MNRYPVKDLAERLGIELGVIGTHRPGDPMTGIRLLAQLTGLSQSTVKRARTAGGFTEWQADRAAVALGLVPWDVWPSWLTDGLTSSIDGGATGGHGLLDRVGAGVARPVVGRCGRLVLAAAA